MNLVSYFVKNMRVVKPTGKTADRNPERRFTVYGEFFSAEVNGDNLTVGDKLSIPSKNIDAAHIVDGFSIDVTRGILTLPEGERGRKAVASLSQDDIIAELAALRGEPTPTAEPVAEPTPTPDTASKASK